MATRCAAGPARVIVVFGATGAQGGSVIRALKGDSKFCLKAVTRKLDSDKAKELAALGVQLVQADIDNRDSVKKAVQGAYGVFLVTNFWEVKDKDKETKQGKTVVDVAKECNVHHLVFSSLSDVKAAIGKECAHFDSKAAVSDYIAKQGIPYTIVRYPFYYENLSNGFFKMTKNDKGEYVLNLPMLEAPLAAISVTDSGEIIHQVFTRPDEFKGQSIGIAGDSLKIREYCDLMTKAFGTKKFVPGTLSPQQFAALGFPGAEELGVMFEFFASDKYKYDIQLTRKLDPKTPTFAQWIVHNKDAVAAQLP